MRAFCQHVAVEQERPAGRQVDQVARCPAGTIFDGVADQLVALRRRDDVMGEPGLRKPRPGDAKRPDAPDAERRYATRLARSVLDELAVSYRNRAAGPVAGEDAALIVDKPARLHRQVSAFGADPGTVSVDDAGPRKVDALNRHVVAVNDEQGLSLTRSCQ